MLSVNGIYEKGQVRLLGNPPKTSGIKVIVTFLEEKVATEVRFTENDFWDVISKINWDAADTREQIRPCINALTEFTPEDIIQFEEILAEKLYQLDGKKFALNIGEFSYKEGVHFSQDIFLYIRCFAVAKGKEYYNKILVNPNELTSAEFEPLLYIGERAYKMLTGGELTFATKYSSETYSNYLAWDLMKPISLI